ncbi:MAG: hypothetical protein GXP53_13805 [Deltaproteobacteria bacterium]|nr:hypothetical protein [Deltaproteobacteria bacterium]
MFQLMLFVGSIIAFIIGGLIVMIGIGAITGCAGGLLIMCTGTVITFISAWSAVTFFLPSPATSAPVAGAINLIKRNGRWI